MSRDQTVTIRLPEALLGAAVRAARIEEITAGAFIRAAVADRVAELDGGQRDALATLRRALRRDFASADGWVDLQRRLRAQKFVLRERRDDLWLLTWPLERPLVPLARLGLSRDELTLLYRAPFPPHAPLPPAPRVVAAALARLVTAPAGHDAAPAAHQPPAQEPVPAGDAAPDAAAPMPRPAFRTARRAA